MKSVIFFILLFKVFPSHGKSVSGEAINLYIENDSRDLGGPGSDNAYSNGFKLSYIAAESDVPLWAKPLIERSDYLQKTLKKSKTNFGISIAQQIYTPNDIRSTELIKNDRPYAAWLYVAFSTNFKNEKNSHSLELDVGVIGPEAQGEKIQNGYHKIIGKYSADGWKNQLATEPTLQLSYQQRLRFFELRGSGKRKYFDSIPFFGAALGNVSVDAHIGGMVRFGTVLPDDFGPARPSSAEGDTFVEPLMDSFPEKSFYLFASARGVLVGRNIFLDGNSFKSSHKVTKVPVMIETELGFVFIYQRASFAWRFVTRSPEFEQRGNINSFASVSLAYAY